MLSTSRILHFLLNLDNGSLGLAINSTSCGIDILSMQACLLAFNIWFYSTTITKPDIELFERENVCGIHIYTIKIILSAFCLS